MPCYCDTPDSDNQVEIEKRCKANMYFEAVHCLTREQAQEAEKRELKQFPLDDVNFDLCQICKILTEDQLKSISAYYYNIAWVHKTLYDWYAQHVIDDFKLKEKL